MDTRCFILMAIQFSSLLLSLASSPSPPCHENERSALLEFKTTFFRKNSTFCFSSPAYMSIESWKAEGESRNCCTWDGIECDKNDGHVIGIDLTSNCLEGNINSNTTLFHLVHLRSLNLAHNYFTFSHISRSAIANLFHLTNLNLSSCGLDGQLPPEILKLSNLSSLDLSENYALELKKPNLLDVLQNLPKLENLSLGKVNISAAIPNIITSFSSLRSLRLDGCDLRGEFPQTIFEMPSLEVLDLSYNYHLFGRLPEFNWRSSLKSISLLKTNFFGELPSTLGNLASLNELILAGSNFLGRIPSSIGRLSNLNYLDLSSNKLVGEVPYSFVNLTQLTHLDLHLNQLRGPVLPHLTKLMHLSNINLSFNNFSGPILSSIVELKNLTYLDLCSNNFNGMVRLSMFSGLKSLVKLQLSFNKLSFVDEPNKTNTYLTNLGILGLASCNLSSFPTFLQYQNGLAWVDLSYNAIYGEIPKWFLNMNIESLLTLNLSSNFLTSSPHEPLNFRWKALRTIDLRDNNLESSLPIPPASIDFYLVSRNNLSGELPPQICELSYIRGIDLDGNNLSGTLPQCLNNLSDTLSFLSLQGNKFYGEIPSLLSNGECNLRMLDLSSNHFQGSLPRSLAYCYELEFLNFGSNRIEDVFPAWLGSLSNLQVLILHSNGFHGPIGEPQYPDDFASLQIIDLSSNNFSSCLPSKYFEYWKAMRFPKSYQGDVMGGAIVPDLQPLMTLEAVYDYTMTIMLKGMERSYPKIQNIFTFIDLSSNNFTCEIPSTIARLVEVQFLNFSNNKLIGAIPSNLKALTKLEALDLSQNKLYGKIPQELVQLTFLGNFNVSYNNLSGSIPKGRQFDTFNNDSYLGNVELCGLPLSKKCGDFQVLPHPQPQQKSEGEESIVIDWKVVLMGYGSGLFIGVVIAQRFTITPPPWMLKYLGRRAQIKWR